MRHDTGKSVLWFLGAVFLVGGGAMLLHYLANGEHVSDFVDNAWRFTFILAPVAGFVHYLRGKLDDVAEHDGLTAREQNRLHHILTGRQHELFAVIIYYVSASMALALLSFMSQAGYPMTGFVLYIIGGTLGLAIFLVFVFWRDVNEVRNFRARLNARLKRAKEKQKILDRMNGNNSAAHS